MQDNDFPAWWLWMTLAFIPVGVWLFIKDRERLIETVQEWARTNEVTLVKRLPTWYRVSPFLLKEFTGGNQKIEYWLVRDSYGKEHRVWLKLGDFFLGATRQVSDFWES